MGQELDYQLVAEADKLWSRLFARGYCTSHYLGYGIQTDTNGHPIGRRKKYGSIWMIGPMRGAEEILMRGRLGLTAQSVIALKHQAFDIAKGISEHI